MFGITDKTQDSGQLVSPVTTGGMNDDMPPVGPGGSSQISPTASIPPLPIATTSPSFGNTVSSNEAHAESADPTPSDLNLSNAYITTDPPKISQDRKTANQAKPTAAAMLNPVPEDDLIQLKQQALHSLAPMLDHLDQSPEERFKTTMMLIQATDNAELVREAYEAANQIKDEKVRAQALLDVVNEINYFTHHSEQNQEAA